MPVNLEHPEYTLEKPKWDKMWDTYKGSDHIKSKGAIYLAPTQSMILDGCMRDANSPGALAYNAYLQRAVYPDYVKDGVESYLGLMHQKDAVIQLPPAMEYLRENATVDGEPLQALLRRMNEEQLVTGRVGLLADLPAQPSVTTPGPYIALYGARSIINWDTSADLDQQRNLTLVVLDESKLIRQNVFEWVPQQRYRVLMLGIPQQSDDGINPTQSTGVYQQGLFKDNGEFEYDESQMSVPSYMGRSLNIIPFAIANTKDILCDIDNPPLMRLAEASLVIYRGEADYRQGLFQQSQDTLVIKGDITTNDDQDRVRTGAGAFIRLGTEGDAKYIGVNSQGLSEQRLSIAADRKAAESRSGALASPTSSQVESGQALEIRLAAQTATLQQVANTGAFALQKVLRSIAQWMNLDPNTVTVTANTDFADLGMLGQDANFWMTAKAQGAPISLESIHARYVQRGLTTLDFETEMSQIKAEQQKYDFLKPPAPTPAPTPTPTPTQPDQQDPAKDDKKPEDPEK